MLNLEHSKTREKFRVSLKSRSEKIFQLRKSRRKRDEKNQQKILLRSQSTKTLLRIRSGFRSSKTAHSNVRSGPGATLPPPAKIMQKGYFWHGKRRQFFARSAKTDAGKKPAQCQQRQGFQPSQRKMTQRKAASKAHAM